MNSSIDQDFVNNRKRASGLKQLSIGLMVLGVLIFAYTVIQLLKSKSTLDSPLLPDYVIWWMNAGLINFTLVNSLGLIPGIFFFTKKQYRFSIYSMVLFLIAGLILKDHLNLHSLFVGWI